MKRLLSVVMCMCICVSLSACKSQEHNSKHLSEYDEGYNYGYDKGYDVGIYDGIDEARSDLTREALYKYQDMAFQAAKECGLHPDEAIIVLEEYLGGEHVSDYELEAAIKSIAYLYYHTVDVIKDIEHMDVYID